MKRYCQTPPPGEEEIIEQILSVTRRLTKRGTAVDIGANDGTWLSNTKFLEERFGFKRFLFDRDGKGNPKVIEAEITPENVNTLFNTYKVPKTPTVLCIDIDGNDYWVRKAINCKPVLIVMEYNGTLDPEVPLSIPYTPDFVWEEDGYFGASLAAMKKLNLSKGYDYVCQCGQMNAFFIREDLAYLELPWDLTPPPIVTPGYTRRKEYISV
jgi:hypothetical protein